MAFCPVIMVFFYFLWFSAAFSSMVQGLAPTWHLSFPFNIPLSFYLCRHQLLSSGIFYFFQITCLDWYCLVYLSLLCCLPFHTKVLAAWEKRTCLSYLLTSSTATWLVINMNLIINICIEVIESTTYNHMTLSLGRR